MKDKDREPGVRVSLTVLWKDQTFGAKGALPPEQAYHWTIDRLIHRVSTSVRRELLKQQYGQDAPGLQEGPIRAPAAMFGGVRDYTAQHSETFFKLAPPDRFSPKWRAWFCTYQESTLDLPLSEPLGIGDTMWVAIENLLRGVEGTEAIEHG